MRSASWNYAGGWMVFRWPWNWPRLAAPCSHPGPFWTGSAPRSTWVRNVRPTRPAADPARHAGMERAPAVRGEKLLARLSVFVAPWTLSDAEAVVDPTGGDVLDDVAGLVENSLVYRHPDALASRSSGCTRQCASMRQRYSTKRPASRSRRHTSTADRAGGRAGGSRPLERAGDGWLSSEGCGRTAASLGARPAA